MKYRIAIQCAEGTYKHVHNIMLETDDIQGVIKRIRNTLEREIKERERLLGIWVQSRTPTGVDKIIKETPDDLIDWNAKGKDISKAEYLDNEIWHDIHGD